MTRDQFEEKTLTIFLTVLLLAFIFVIICGINSTDIEQTVDNTSSEFIIESTEEDITDIFSDNRVYIAEIQEYYCNIDNLSFVEECIDYDAYYSEKDIEMIAKVLYREARGEPLCNIAAVAWCILNRVDQSNKSIEQIITEPYQFAWVPDTPVWKDTNNNEHKNLYGLAEDVLQRWVKEKLGEQDVGRVLPKDYIYFFDRGQGNIFRNKFSNYTDENFWDWSLPNPYK